MEDLCWFCKKEEKAKLNFFKWLAENKCKLNRDLFMHIYVHAKKRLPDLSLQHLANRKKFLEHEKEELLTSFFSNEDNLAIPQKKDELEEKNGEHPVVYQLGQSIIDLENTIVQLWLQIKENRCEMRESINSRELQDENLIKKTPSPLKCLQINLKHKDKAWEKLVKRLVVNQSHIVFIQEPYLKLEPNSNYIHFPSPPEKYRIIHNLYLDKNFPSRSTNYYGAMILVHEDVNFQRIMPVIEKDYSYQHLVAGIRLLDVNISLYSIYCRPSKSLALILKPLQPPDGMSRTVFCMDANAVHPSWSFNTQNMAYVSGRGEDLEFFIRKSKSLQVANKKIQIKIEEKNSTNDAFKKAKKKKTYENIDHIDVTLHGEGIAKITDWEVLTGTEDESFSDHRYIRFSILVRSCSLPNVSSIQILSVSTHFIFMQTREAEPTTSSSTASQMTKLKKFIACATSGQRHESARD